MILTWLLPDLITRPLVKNELERKLEFLENVIAEAENGQSIHESFHSHRYPGLSHTHIEKFFQLSFGQGLAILPPLREFAREVRFRIEREREISIEIAPARATLTLLTYFPALILLGALLTKIIHFDHTFFAPIPLMMIAISVIMQIIGRRWAENIINAART